MQNSTALALSSDLIKQACIRWPVLVPRLEKRYKQTDPPPFDGGFSIYELDVYTNLKHVQNFPHKT